MPQRCEDLALLCELHRMGRESLVRFLEYKERAVCGLSRKFRRRRLVMDTVLDRNGHGALKEWPMC